MPWSKVGNIRGPSGLGVPPGGTTGQMLAKKTNADNDTQWAPPASGPQGPPGATGPTGATGATGPPGTPGETWFTGSGVPAGVTGIVGDWYLNSANGDYYEKTGAGAWTLRGNLRGPAGPTGADSTVPGPPGATGPAGSTGPAGPTGSTGSQGPAGVGVPVGGTTGQVLSKKTGTDYDTQWSTGGAGTADTRGYHRYSTTPPGDLVDGQIWLDSDLVVPPTTNPDHGFLTGLADDDHPQYLTEARQNFRIFTTTALLNAWAAPNGSRAQALDTNYGWLRRSGAWEQESPRPVWYVEQTSGQTGIGTTIVDITGCSITLTALAGHRYKIMYGALFTPAAAGISNIILTDGANAMLSLWAVNIAANAQTYASGYIVKTPIAGSVTWKLRASHQSSTLQIVSAAAYPCNLLVEDMGVV